MAPADNIRQRDQRVIRKFEKKKGRHRKMKKNVKRLIAGAVVLLVAAGIVVRIAGGNKKEEEYETRPTVAVENPKTGDITLYTDLTGTIEPISKAVVQPKIGGELLEVNFQAGDQVEAGQVLCKIDSDALTALQLQMQSASVAADNAARELARIQPLYASGYISQQQFDQAQSSATSAQLAYESAKNQYDLQVEYTTVTAPISGVIESRNVEPHDHIGTDTKICVISGGDQLQVKFGVTEKILRNMKVNDPVQVEKNGTDYEGNVTEIGSMVNSATGLYDAKAFVNNAESLTSGTKVKLTVVMDQVKDVLTVPVDAVNYDNGKAFVYCYDNGAAKKVMIEAGIYDAQTMEVKSGLTAGDQVITTWSNELVDGQEVLIDSDNGQNENAAQGESAAENAGEETQKAQNLFIKIRRRISYMADTQEKKVCPCCTKHTMRSEEERKKLINRLKRVEGQIRGIIGMLENDAYCNDILIQSAAVNAAVNAFNKELLASHIHNCVARDIREGKDETIDELVATLQKLMK